MKREREGDSDKENRVGERKSGIYTRLSFSIVLYKGTEWLGRYLDIRTYGT